MVEHQAGLVLVGGLPGLLQRPVRGPLEGLVDRLRVDEAHRHIEWGADERTYSGWLTVAGEDGGAQVVAHLSFAPYVTPSGSPITGEPDIDPDPIEESLEAALDSLRNLMEGRGGKESPASVG